MLGFKGSMVPKLRTATPSRACHIRPRKTSGFMMVTVLDLTAGGLLPICSQHALPHPLQLTNLFMPGKGPLLPISVARNYGMVADTVQVLVQTQPAWQFDITIAR